jgi:hypothetical protein
MTQQAKKQSSQPAVKLASTVVNKTAKSSIDVMESTRASAESAVEIGSAAAKDLLANSSSEAKKAQEKVFEMGREGAEKISKSADVVTKSLYEAISASRDNVETAIECGNLTASFAKDISSELVEYANKAFSDNVELSKSMFACRTINDMLFEYSTEALEPINERVAQTTEQLSKKLSGAA